MKPRALDDPESGMPVARYPEYDYETRSERPDWTTVVEYPQGAGRDPVSRPFATGIRI